MIDRADVAIVGGGPVGAALAVALAKTDLQVVVLEARAAAGGDRRPLALSYGSRLILERIGAWDAIREPTPIDSIHVSQSHGFGRAKLDAREAGMPALGYVTDYSEVHGALVARAERDRQMLRDTEALSIESATGGFGVRFRRNDQEGRLVSRLVVVADGGAQLQLGRWKKVDYGQSAVVAIVGSERPHNHTAFERFTEQGPLALLPMGRELALVWCVREARAQSLCEAPEREFCAELESAFGRRLGRFSLAGTRASYPLSLRFLVQQTLPGAVVIGNAAQTLHPVAGQGFNLGLRDAWELADEIRRCGRPEDLSRPDMFDGYRARRRADRVGGIAFTDFLVRTFSNDFPPLRAIRGCGLALLGCLPPARDFVVRRMVFGARG
jgi:2-octaprenyl-6-methoxyphenol hydroxylase